MKNTIRSGQERGFWPSSAFFSLGGIRSTLMDIGGQRGHIEGEGDNVCYRILSNAMFKMGGKVAYLNCKITVSFSQHFSWQPCSCVTRPNTFITLNLGTTKK